MPRTLSEEEFNRIKEGVLATLPANLSEAELNRITPSMLDGAIGAAENSSAPLTDSAISRLTTGIWKHVNPVTMATGLATAALHPVDTLHAFVTTQGAELDKAADLVRQGRYSEAVGHGAAGLLPFVGPAAAAAGERMGSGDIAGGVGEGLGVIASVFAPRAAVKVAPQVIAAAREAGPALQGPVSTGLGATGRALEAAGQSRAAQMAQYGGLYEAAAHLDPRGLILAATPPVVRATGRGLQRAGAWLAPAAEADVVPPHLNRAVPIRPSDLTPDQLAERIQYGQGTPTPRTPTYAPRPSPGSAAPPPTAPAVPEPPVAPAPPESAPTPAAPSGFGWSPQRIRNEVGLAARRMKVTLTDAQAQAAQDLVATGRMPTAAVAEVAPPKTAAALEPALPPAAKPKVTAAEMKEYTRLRRLGKSHAEATAVLQVQRDLAQRLGTPTSEVVRQTVAERNVSGEWPE